MLNLFSGKKRQAQAVIKELVSQLLEGGSFSLSFQIEKKRRTFLSWISLEKMKGF